MTDTRVLASLQLLVVGMLALAPAGASAGHASVTGQLSVVASTGGTKQALSSAWSVQPALSPDGRTIAYESGSGIQLMTTDGREQRPLGAADGERPQWSPDGRSLLYTGENADACNPFLAKQCVIAELWRVGSDGSGMRRLVFAADHPVWSPTGRWVAFRNFVGGEGGELVGSVKIARPDGSRVRTLFVGQAINGVQSLPTWSPDGKWIAFNIWRGEQFRLLVIKVDGSHLRRLTGATGATYPTWSPDGKLIAFQRWRGQPDGIWVISPSGKGARRVSAGGDCPTWSPKGKRIAFLTPTWEGGPPARLVVVGADGHNRKVLGDATGCYDPGWAEPSPPVWSRDGGRIYFVG